MSKFYGTVIGQANTAATRRGSMDSGIRAAAQSYDGSVITTLDYASNGKLIVRIGTSDRSSIYIDEYIFNGTFEELKAAGQLLKQIKSGEASVVKHRKRRG